MALAEKKDSELEAPRERLVQQIWGIGVRHVVFMALGAALYAGASYATNSLALPGASNVSLRPGIVLPLFFGVAFGPWVGLFTGVVGNSINDMFSYGIYWNWEIGIGLIGFVAGLTMYFTRGRYTTTRRIVLAEVAGVIALVVGLGFASLTDIWVSHLSFTTAMTTEFIPALLPDMIFGLILLPILLLAYTVALGRSGR
jgi:energy-coupling factor transport system substrate-specific component